MVDSRVEIHLAGDSRPPTAIPVNARVVADVEVTPSSLVLPRSSTAGPVYEAKCICISNGGHSLALSVEDTPEGLSARVVPVEGKSDTQIIHIQADPKRMGGLDPKMPSIVRLRARAGEKTALATIAVFWRE
jgi:hypothetical protein